MVKVMKADLNAREPTGMGTGTILAAIDLGDDRDSDIEAITTPTLGVTGKCTLLFRADMRAYLPTRWLNRQMPIPLTIFPTSSRAKTPQPGCENTPAVRHVREDDQAYTSRSSRILLTVSDIELLYDPVG